MVDKPTQKNSIDFLGTAVDIYNGYKISKDGLSREEDVRVMQGIEEEEQVRNKGWRIFKKVFNREQENGVESKPER